MVGRRATLGGAAGLVVTGLTLTSLREFTPEFQRAVSILNVSGTRGPLIGVMLLGAVIGVAALGSRFHPLVSGVPAVLLFIVYLPLLIDLTIPDWYPDWLGDTVLFSFGPTPYLAIGVLTAVAASRMVEQLRANHQSDAVLTG